MARTPLLTTAGLTALALCTALTLPATAAPPEPGAYGRNDAGGFRNILPPGQNGHADAAQVIAFTGLDRTVGGGSAPVPPHTRDQLDLYGDLVYASPTLQAGELSEFFKDATFGVREGEADLEYSPRGDVTIQRDEDFGVPRIYGRDRRGAMFGAGYVGAEDRLFLMDVLRHLGRAQVSSFIGGAEGNRELDHEQWQIAPYKEADLQRQYDLGDEVYGEQGERLQEDVRNYVAGINKYVCEASPATEGCSGDEQSPTPGSKNGDTPAQKLPGAYGAITPNGESGPLAARVKPWKVTDVIATASLVGGIFGKGGGRELLSAQILQAAQAKFAGSGEGRRVWSDFRSAEDPEAPVTTPGSFPYQVPPANAADDSKALPDPGTVDPSETVQPGGSGPGAPGGILPGFPFAAASTSNALVVSGRESSSGTPLAVFGPQTGYFSPQLLMELDIHAPANGGRQGIDARGAAFPGVNLYVQLGRGRDYAWSATSAGQDNVDTFALELCNPSDATGALPVALNAGGYRYRGKCLPFEALTRTNTWAPNAADQTFPPGGETLRANRTKLGIEIARALIGGKPFVYVQLRSTYMHEADSALGFVDYNDPRKMDTPEEFQRAASKIGFTFNWFFTNEDSVAYFNSGNNPERPAGPDPNFPVRACPTNATSRCKYEWIGWDPDTTPGSPNMFVSDYTPFGEHPQTIDQRYLTSWNNKQARAYRAADDNFSYQSIHRSEPLDDRIRPRIAGAGKMSLRDLTDAMEDAGTVDLRGDKVLPFALELLGSESDPQVASAIAKLRAWVEDGAHRRDKNHNGVYEHTEAIKIMDAWWPRWIEAQFKPALGADLYDKLVDMIGLDDEPNNSGEHRGSAYIAGWYGYAEKDLRSILGRNPPGEYSRQYCGGGSRSACETILRDSLKQAIAADRASTYDDPGGDCDDDPEGFEDDQLCFDAIFHTAVGAVEVPPIHWINRPTFQQAVEVGARIASNQGDDGGDDSRRRRSRGGSGDRGGAGRGGGSGVAGAADLGDADDGELPFTGFALALVALLGLLLLGGGVELRRRLRRRR